MTEGNNYYNWIRRVSAALAIFLIAFLVYAETIGHGFVWEDAGLIGAVQEKGIRSLYQAGFSSYYYRPLVFLSFWLDSLLSHLPYVFHLSNVIFHALNSVLVYCLLGLLLPSRTGAFWGAVLFALHPVHTESVAFVADRTDLLSTTFVLLSVIGWANWRRRLPDASFYGGLAAFLLGCLSKETAYMLPGVLLIWDQAGIPSNSEVKPRWRERNGRWIIGWGAVLVAVLLARVLLGGAFNLGYANISESHIGPALDNPLLFAAMWLEYLRLLVLPWPLSPFYSPAMLGPTTTTVIASLLFLLFCLFSARSRHGHTGMMALVWIFAFLLPVSGILPLGGRIIAERYLYLPSVGLCLLAGYGVDRIARASFLRPAVPVFLLLAILLGAGTMDQARIWKNETSIWQHVARTAPSEWFPHYSLAISYAKQGRFKEALTEITEAARLNPGSFDIHMKAGAILVQMRRFEEASRAYSRAAAIKPGEKDALYNLGISLYEARNPKKALEAFAAASALNPRDTQTLTNMGILYLEMGTPGKAVEVLLAAILTNSKSVEAHYRLGLAYLAMGKKEPAGREYEILKNLDSQTAERLRGRITGAANFSE